MRRAALKHAKANAAHVALGRLQREHPGRVTIVTQNIDHLHEDGGADAVIHMHGELRRALCAACNARFDCVDDLAIDTACTACEKQGMLRPDVVWFGEVPYRMDEILSDLVEADLFVSIGTSGNVYPAAGFVAEARAQGAHTVELNLEPSAGASLFDECHHAPATEIVPAFVQQLLSN